jgi:DNA-binding CsgD family transcriptional regulator
VIEATQAAARDDEMWARGVVDSARKLFTSEPVLALLEHTPRADSARYNVLATGLPELKKLLADGPLHALGVAGLRAFFYPPTLAATHREIEQAAPSEIATRGIDLRQRSGFGDAVGAFAHPAPGVVVTFFTLHRDPIRLSPYDRGLLGRFALHLETSYRLRRRPEALKAVLDADGQVLERTADAPPAHVLSAHAAEISRARRERDGDAALGLWPALLAGRLSVVQRRVGSKTRYLVVENAPSTQPFRALSPAEVEVVSQAARGHSMKLIAYALGVSPSAVSGHLMSAAGKIGASSRMELVRLAAMLTRDPRAGFLDIALTDAERDVLHLLQQGLTNDQIAKIRSRSVRTIANQVASLLHKTNSSSRRALLVLRASPRDAHRGQRPLPQ